MNTTTHTERVLAASLIPRAALPAALPSNLAYTPTGTEWEGYTPVWEDYVAQIELRGTVREIAAVTVYPDGHVLVNKSARIRTSTEHACWNNLVRALGGIPAENRASYCTRPTI